MKILEEKMATAAHNADMMIADLKSRVSAAEGEYRDEESCHLGLSWKHVLYLHCTAQLGDQDSKHKHQISQLKEGHQKEVKLFCIFTSPGFIHFVYSCSYNLKKEKTRRQYCCIESRKVKNTPLN